MFGMLITSAIASQASLVIDGGFESGSLSPNWSGYNNGLTTTAADVHSGTYAGVVSPSAGSLVQYLPTMVGGNAYLVTFWAKSTGEGTLTLGLDTAPVIDIVSPPSLTTTYQQYSFVITPTTVGSLQFTWNDGGTQSAFIDDVSVVAVPEPSTVLAGMLLLVPLGISTARIVRRNRGA